MTKIGSRTAIFVGSMIAFAGAWQIEPLQGKPIVLKKDTLFTVPGSGSMRIVDAASHTSLLLRGVSPEAKILVRWAGPTELLSGTEGVQVVRKGSDQWHFLSHGKPVGLAFRENPPASAPGPTGVSAQRASRLAATMLSTSTRGGHSETSRDSSAGEPVSLPDLSQAYQGWKLPATTSREAQAWALFRKGRDLDAARLALKAVAERSDNFASAEVLLLSSNDRELRRLVDSAVRVHPTLGGKLAIALVRTGVRRTGLQWKLQWLGWGDAYAIARVGCEYWLANGEMDPEQVRALSRSPLTEIVVHPDRCRTPDGPLYVNPGTDSTDFERESRAIEAALRASDTTATTRWVGWSARYPQSGRAAVLEAQVRLLRNTPEALGFAEKSLERVLDETLSREVESKRGGRHEEFLLWLGERHPWAESL